MFPTSGTHCLSRELETKSKWDFVFGFGVEIEKTVVRGVSPQDSRRGFRKGT